MTTYEDVRRADLEWQRQIRAVEVARRALIDATARAEAAWRAFEIGRASCRERVCHNV